MIVCSCRAVSDIVRVTGAGTDCGCCTESVERIVATARPCRPAPCTGCPNAGLAA
jgi:bacterioferritin-associated ferredoxin